MMTDELQYNTEDSLKHGLYIMTGGTYGLIF